MNTIDYVFSFLCSQDASRSFAIAGQLLPFCQRCTGVYVGMGISFLYLLLSRHYRKGLPPRSILYVNIASLLIMPLLGFHIFDPGAAWRFWSGLIFGNAIVFLLLPAVSTILNEGRIIGHYTKTSTLCFFALSAFLNTIPLWFPIQSIYYYAAALVLSLAGLIGVIYCIVAIMMFAVKKTINVALTKGLGHGWT